MTHAPACPSPSSVSASTSGISIHGAKVAPTQTSTSGERGEDRSLQEQALLEAFRRADKRKRELILRFARQLTA